MKVFSLRKDYGLRDAGDPAELGPVLEKINLAGENEIVVDLKGCLLDYPGSSAILDKIITSWEGKPGKKKVTILLNYQLKMATIISWLFRGGCKIDNHLIKDLTFEQFEELIKEYLRTVEAALTIRIETLDKKVSETVYE